MFVYNFKREKEANLKFWKSCEEICKNTRQSLYFEVAVVKKYHRISSMNQ